MGGGRKAPQEPDRTDVSGSKGTLDSQAKEPVQQRGIVGAAVSTIRHFFGAFSPLLSQVVDRRDPQKIKYPLAGPEGVPAVQIRIQGCQRFKELARKQRSAGRLEP